MTSLYYILIGANNVNVEKKNKPARIEEKKKEFRMAVYTHTRLYAHI